MTRKDYILIAAALKSADPAVQTASFDPYSQHRLTAQLLANKLGADNPRFDRERFLRAAGVQS